jgi:hypothetical protein
MAFRDPRLIDQLDALPKEAFSGHVYRATRQSLDPLVASYAGGRWMPRDSVAILYTSFERDGALAEMSFHLSQQNPVPTRPLVVHKIRVASERTLRLVRADLSSLGVSDAEYLSMNHPRTQEIGAAVEFIGCDGLIAPSARWHCDNLMLFTDRMAAGALELDHSENVNWLDWWRKNGN